jgi:hypothetical protein
VLRELSPHSARRLGSEVEGQVFLVLVEKSELGALVGIDDCEDPGDRFPEIVAAVLEERRCQSIVLSMSSISSLNPRDLSPEPGGDVRKELRTSL